MEGRTLNTVKVMINFQQLYDMDNFGQYCVSTQTVVEIMFREAAIRKMWRGGQLVGLHKYVMWLNARQKEGATIGLLCYYIQTNSRMQATFNPTLMQVRIGFNFYKHMHVQENAQQCVEFLMDVWNLFIEFDE